MHSRVDETEKCLRSQGRRVLRTRTLSKATSQLWVVVKDLNILSGASESVGSTALPKMPHNSFGDARASSMCSPPLDARAHSNKSAKFNMLADVNKVCLMRPTGSAVCFKTMPTSGSLNATVGTTCHSNGSRICCQDTGFFVNLK